MDYNTLRSSRTVTADQDQYFLIGDSVAIHLGGDWFLNEERMFVSDVEDAVSVIQEKENTKNSKKLTLVNETYSVEAAIKLIKIYNNRITQNVLESCIDAASSKSLTNNEAVLEIRKLGSTVCDKYIFVLENQDIVALAKDEVDLLKRLDDETIQRGRQSAEELKEILRGI